MLTFSQMFIRLLLAILLGAIMGFERERLGKEAGIRTAMLVSAGASIFTMISVSIPHLTGVEPVGILPDRVISNIVVGIGFLGAGIMIQSGERGRGLTTAALIWTVAAIGTLVGLGLFDFAATTAITLSGLLYLTRRIGLSERVRPKEHSPKEH